MSGSMLNRSLRHDRRTLAAGLFSEKVGMIENPLFVMPKDPEKVVLRAVESCDVCGRTIEHNSIKAIERMRVLNIFHLCSTVATTGAGSLRMVLGPSCFGDAKLKHLFGMACIQITEGPTRITGQEASHASACRE